MCFVTSLRVCLCEDGSRKTGCVALDLAVGFGCYSILAIRVQT